MRPPKKKGIRPVQAILVAPGPDSLSHSEVPPDIAAIRDNIRYVKSWPTLPVDQAIPTSGSQSLANDHLNSDIQQPSGSAFTMDDWFIDPIVQPQILVELDDPEDLDQEPLHSEETVRLSVSQTHHQLSLSFHLI